MSLIPLVLFSPLVIPSIHQALFLLVTSATIVLAPPRIFSFQHSKYSNEDQSSSALRIAIELSVTYLVLGLARRDYITWNPLASVGLLSIAILCSWPGSSADRDRTLALSRDPSSNDVHLKTLTSPRGQSIDDTDVSRHGTLYNRLSSRIATIRTESVLGSAASANRMQRLLATVSLILSVILFRFQKPSVSLETLDGHLHAGDSLGIVRGPYWEPHVDVEL